VGYLGIRCWAPGRELGPGIGCWDWQGTECLGPEQGAAASSMGLRPSHILYFHVKYRTESLCGPNSFATAPILDITPYPSSSSPCICPAIYTLPIYLFLQPYSGNHTALCAPRILPLSNNLCLTSPGLGEDCWLRGRGAGPTEQVLGLWKGVWSGL